jgi:DNA-binding NtrC family response regulator
MGEPEKNLLLVTADTNKSATILPKLKWAEHVHNVTSVYEIRELVGRSLKFSSILTELTVKDGAGFLVVSKILSLYPLVPVIVIHDVFDEDVAALSFQYGAVDFLAPTDQVSTDSLERAVRLANLRIKYNGRGRMLLDRLDKISSRARELAYGVRNSTKGPDRQIELVGKVPREI